MKKDTENLVTKLSFTGLEHSMIATTRTRADLTTIVAGRIVEYIREKQLQPGDRLPPARAMAATYSVATPTLREALRRLQATGVIDIRHGSGIYVRGDLERMVIANPVPQFSGMESQVILDLLDARQQLDPPLARRAAVRATVADIAKLEQLLAAAATLLEDHDDLLGPKNMAFHTSIARIAGNRILAHVMESLVELYDSEQFAILFMYDARARDHAEHKGILEAIREHDSDLAEARMIAHLAEVRHVVAANLQTSQPNAKRIRSLEGEI